MTLSDSFKPTSNSLNVIRLLLAAAVIVSHSWPVGGYGTEPSWGNETVGGWALFGFFTLSGYLITRSRLSGQRARDFYWARFLRIYPGFIVCLLVIAFIFAPVSQLLKSSGTYSIASAVTFVLRNSLLYAPVGAQVGISGTLTNVPFTGYWDGSLWTLFFEAAAYVSIGLLASIIPRRFFPRVVAVVFILATAASLAGATGLLALNVRIEAWTPLVIAFTAGSLLFLYGHRIRAGSITTALAFFTLVLIGVLGFIPSLGSMPLGFLLLRLGIVLPLNRIGSKYDISYGIYIYGWPVQQLIALIFPNQVLPVMAYIIVCIVITVPIAMLSSVLVEKPALRLKRSRPASVSLGSPTGLSF